MREQTWDELADVLRDITYTRDVPPGDRFKLVRHDSDNYAVLYIFTYQPNTYKPEQMRHTRHEFLVPVATYNRSTWVRWVFDKIASIELHETCESFQVRDESKCEVTCLCKYCEHARTLHDGRYSTCDACGPEDEHKHRFVCADGHYTRIYAPHHGNGEDPYSFWPGGTAEQKAKKPGED